MDVQRTYLQPISDSKKIDKRTLIVRRRKIIMTEDKMTVVIVTVVVTLFTFPFRLVAHFHKFINIYIKV